MIIITKNITKGNFKRLRGGKSAYNDYIGLGGEYVVFRALSQVGLDVEMTPKHHPVDILSAGHAIEVKTILGNYSQVFIDKRAKNVKYRFAKDNDFKPLTIVVLCLGFVPFEGGVGMMTTLLYKEGYKRFQTSQMYDLDDWVERVQNDI